MHVTQSTVTSRIISTSLGAALLFAIVRVVMKFGGYLEWVEAETPGRRPSALVAGLIIGVPLALGTVYLLVLAVKHLTAKLGRSAEYSNVSLWDFLLLGLTSFLLLAGSAMVVTSVVSGVSAMQHGLMTGILIPTFTVGGTWIAISLRRMARSSKVSDRIDGSDTQRSVVKSK